MDILLLKQQQRTAMKKIIASLSDQEKARRSQLICVSLQNIVSTQEKKIIAVYTPFPSEPNIDLLYAGWKQKGYTLLFPGGTDTDPCFLNYNHQGVGTDTRVVSADIILVPGVAFTHGGQRLGRGGGWYDRAISHAREINPHCRVIGVCFHGQLVADLPTDQYDQLMDEIVSA